MIRIPVYLIYCFSFRLPLHHLYGVYLRPLLFFFFLFRPFVRLKSFRRWMSETCLPCPPTKLDNNEPYVFSFYEDIVQVNRLALPFRSLSVYYPVYALVVFLNEKYRKISFTLISSIWKNVYHCLIHAYLYLFLFLLVGIWAKAGMQSGRIDVDKSCLSQFKSLEMHICLSVLFVCRSTALACDINKTIDFRLFQEITLVFLLGKEIKLKLK